MARPHTLDMDPERVEIFAKNIAEGVPNKKNAEAMGVSIATVVEWKKREDVQRLVTRMMRERSNRIRAKTDTAILAKLEGDKPLDIYALLKIRAEFSTDDDGDDTPDGTALLTKLMERASHDPALARALKEALGDDRTGD